MRIYLDNALGHITITRMLPFWTKMGHTITTNSSDKFDVQLSYVRIGQKTNKPVIQRIDGIYYDSATDYKNRNIAISNSHAVADGIIYQSKYSKSLIERLLKQRKPNVKYSVIYNGIDESWPRSYVEHDEINITITGKHRRHKRLKEITELFVEYNKKYPNSFLHIFGILHDNKEIKHKNVIYYGQVERIKMQNVFRKTDFSIHLSKRDSCPNSVVEYIGAGIPVITTDNCGGATEMCKMTEGCIIIKGDGSYFDTNPVPHYSEEWNILSPDVKTNLLSAMYEMTENKRRVNLPIELTAKYQAEQYIKLMKDLVDGFKGAQK